MSIWLGEGDERYYLLALVRLGSRFCARSTYEMAAAAFVECATAGVIGGKKIYEAFLEF